jgi:hypothetical protein
MAGQQTLLILDANLRRVGLLEQALSQMGLNVFRTSRAREAAKLFSVVKPFAMIVATESEGAEFYRRFVVDGQSGQTICFVLQDGSLESLRPQDIVLDGRLPHEQIVQSITQGLRSRLGQGTPPPMPTLEPPISDDALRGISPDSSPSSPSLNTTGTRSSSSLHRNREWKGLLAQLDVARLFSILLLRRSTGKLLLSNTHETRRVWMNQGVILCAESNKPLPQFAVILQKDSILKAPAQLTPEQQQIFLLPRPGERLFELGLIERASILRVDRRYTEQIVVSSFAWEEGGFCFIPGAEDLPVPPLKIEMPPLLLQGIRAGYSARRLLALLNSVDRVPQWFSNRLSEGQLPLNVIEKRIIQHIDGKRSLAQIQQAANTDAVLIHALVYALMVLGYLTMADSPKSDGMLSVQKLEPSPASSEIFQVEASSPAAASFSRPALSSPKQPLSRPATMPNIPSPLRKDAIFQVEQERTASSARSAPSPTVNAPSVRVQQNPRRTQNVRATMTLRSMGAFQQGIPQAAYESQAANQKTETHRSPEEIRKLYEQVLQKHNQVMTLDYFRILELEPDASDLDIRRAYQQLRARFAEEQLPPAMREKLAPQIEEIHTVLQEAFDVLGEAPLRLRYRAHLEV